MYLKIRHIKHKIEFDPLEGIVLERKVFDIDFSIRLKCSIEF